MIDKIIELYDKGYCNECNELNCLGGEPSSKTVANAIRELQQENKQLKERKNEALNYIKNYNSMEFRYQDKNTMNELDIIKKILNNRLDFEDEDIEIIRLKNQLKQRDEVIDKIYNFVNHYRHYIKVNNKDYLKDREHFGYLDKWQIDDLLGDNK